MIRAVLEILGDTLVISLFFAVLFLLLFLGESPTVYEV